MNRDYSADELQEAIEDFYAGQIDTYSGYEAKETDMYTPPRTILKSNHRHHDYQAIAQSLYRVRPISIDAEEAYLDHLSAMIALVFLTDPTFCLEMFLDRAALYYDEQGKLCMHPF